MATLWARSIPDTVLILDFDGTIALSDVGDVLCDRFSPPEWADIDALVYAQALSLDEAQRRMWALARCTADEFDAVTDETVLRPGLDALLDRADRGGTRLVLASGGFDRYIRRVLGERMHRFEALYANHLQCERVSGENRVTVSFPHKGSLGCESCAVCKGRVCGLYKAQGCRVIFVGDGNSDRCALGRADRVFAVRGSWLHEHALRVKASVTPFDHFDEVLRDVQKS